MPVVALEAVVLDVALETALFELEPHADAISPTATTVTAIRPPTTPTLLEQVMSRERMLTYGQDGDQERVRLRFAEA